MALKITSQNIGFSLNNGVATITGQFPTSISRDPFVINTSNPIIINNFTPGQKTFSYITANPTEVTAIEAAVSVIPVTTECT